MPTLERLQALSTTVAISSRTAYHPDAADAHLTSVNFHALVELGGLGWLSGSGSVVVGMTEHRYAELLATAVRAVDVGSGSLGVDTAVGRPVTTLEVTVREHHLDDTPRSAQFGLNHLDVAGRGPTAWRILIEDLVSCLGDRASEADRVHMAELAAWFRIRPPHPAFDEGIAVPCPPQAAVEVPLDEGVFVRVGQRNDTRGLWLVHRDFYRSAVIIDVSRTATVGQLSFHEGTWQPGGDYAGRLTIAFNPSAKPNRITVDARDPEGVFVQPATFEEVRALGAACGA